MLRHISMFLVLAWAVTCLSQANADSLSLSLIGAGPTGTVVLSGSALPSPYQGGVNVYAGLLDWQVPPTPSTPTLYTYCIDVQSVISIGNTYSFNEVPLASSGLFSTPVLNAVENLWSDQGAAGNTTNGANISDGTAATFQVALWDIINDFYQNAGSSSTPVIGTPPLSFSSPGSGFSSSDLTTALAWATQAYADGAYTGTASLDALVAQDGSQNQAIYLGSPAPAIASTPLPPSYAGGLALFGIIGMLTLPHRNRASVS
jgi:hypothetical protein